MDKLIQKILEVLGLKLAPVKVKTEAVIDFLLYCLRMAAQKRLFTGLQPTGQLHIGNYFGALKPMVETVQTKSMGSS